MLVMCVGEVVTSYALRGVLLDVSLITDSFG